MNEFGRNQNDPFRRGNESARVKEEVENRVSDCQSEIELGRVSEQERERKNREEAKRKRERETWKTRARKGFSPVTILPRVTVAFDQSQIFHNHPSHAIMKFKKHGFSVPSDKYPVELRLCHVWNI